MNIDTNGLTKAFDGDSIYDNAVYHTMTASWIVPQNDPYKLSNFQIALDNLLSGKSDVVLTESIRNTLSDFFNLSPTHYALKVYPRNEDEQWRIESMDDVKVSYIPLNYIQLTDNQVKKANLNDTYKRFNEEYRYTFTYTDIICDDEKVEDETITMPILYVVWPKQKELPKDIDYTLDYEVFIPDHSSDNNQAMGILEDEAIRLALGKRDHIELYLHKTTNPGILC